jgi:hypothetical protein
VNSSTFHRHQEINKFNFREKGLRFSPSLDLD